MEQKSFFAQSKYGLHRVAYTEFGVRSLKPPVLCLHGLTRNGRDFDRLAVELAAQGRHVFCPDMIGRGQSDWVADPALYSYEQYLADIVAFLLHIQAPIVDCVGTSMGGLLGLLLASHAVSPIRRLVMNDVGPYLSAEILKQLTPVAGWSRSFATFEELDEAHRRIHGAFGPLTDEEWTALARTASQQMPDGRWIFAYDPAIAEGLKPLKEDLSFWSYYATATSPILVLHGSASTVLSEATARRMALTGPKAKVVRLEGIGHAPPLVSKDQIQLVADFLE
jgi:pimeloyl-ACP methyl ester carboxylesterase